MNSLSNNTYHTDPVVSIRIPEPFLGIDGEPWSATNRDGSSSQLGFFGVLMHTLRQTLPTDTLSNQKSLQAFRIIQLAQKQNDQSLDMSVELFYWMVNYFQHGESRVWKAPDLALLIETLMDSMNIQFVHEHVDGDPNHSHELSSTESDR